MTTGLTLALEGSTYAGSVALIRGRDVIALRQVADEAKPGRAGRAEHFMPMVAECLRDGKAAPGDLERIVCGAGPGSFTSLRVAASIAKGIAVGTGKPLYSVSSLALVVAAAAVGEGRWLATIPAMRNEVFAQLFEISGASMTELGAPRIIADHLVDDEGRHFDADVLGPDRKVANHPHAMGVAMILDSIIAGGPCDIDTWEPVYGRLAEAQVRWEAAHGRPLSAS